MADISGWIGAQPYGAQVQQFRELLQQRGEAVAAAFSQRCEEEGVEADIEIGMGHPSRVILEAEARTELLVLGQKGEHASLIGDMMGSNVERVARHAATPCLVTPETFAPVTRILAAYDGSGHGAKALHEAVELAAALDVEVLVLTVAESHDAEEADQIAADGFKMAEAHGCRASQAVVAGRTGRSDPRTKPGRTATTSSWSAPTATHAYGRCSSAAPPTNSFPKRTSPSCSFPEA